MITFGLDDLRAVAKAAQTSLDYWRELFDADSVYNPTIPLGFVAVVVNAAIEAGVVIPPASVGERESYRQGYDDGAAYAEQKQSDEGDDPYRGDHSDIATIAYGVGYERGKAAMRRELLGDRVEAVDALVGKAN